MLLKDKISSHEKIFQFSGAPSDDEPKDIVKKVRRTVQASKESGIRLNSALSSEPKSDFYDADE